MECCMIVPLSLLIRFVHSGCWPEHCKILLCEYDPFIVIEHCSVNQILSNGIKLIFLGHSSFRVIHWETIITKVHSQTLMAMKSGCKIYTRKCYVTLEWPLNVKFQT